MSDLDLSDTPDSDFLGFELLLDDEDRTAPRAGARVHAEPRSSR